MVKKVSEVDGCAGCPFRALFPDNTFVAPRVGSNLRLAIGEAPGAQEAEQGQPFVGGSGRWLKVFYGKAGVNEADNSVISVIQCRPPNNIFPTDSLARSYISDSDAHKTVEHCLQNHVIPFLKRRQWKRIDTFGDKPLRFILGKSGGVTQWRGTVLPVPLLQEPESSSGTKPTLAIPTFHPAYIARDQSMIPIVIQDLKKGLETDPEYYNIYPSIEDVRAFKATKFAFDIETDRWNHNEIQLVGLSAENYKAIVIPFHEPYISELKRIFANATEVIGQNCLQFDLPHLAKNGITIRGPKECTVWDIMLMHHLRFPVFPHDLEFIGKQFTNKGAWKADKQSFETYNARDTDVTFRCFGALYGLLEQAQLLGIYRYVSWPLALICRYMTEQGVYLSGSRIKELRAEYTQKMAELETLLPPELRTYTVTKRKRLLAPAGTVNAKGKPVKYVYEEYQEPVTPWRSSDVKKKYLYETLGLPVQLHIRTKQPTVDKGALDKLYTRHKLPELRTLKALNKYATLLSGFAGESLERQDVLHPSFNVHGTETGRLSSSGPNIQNQPAGVRFMFVSRYPGGLILSFDYSGIENRIVAKLADDRKRATWLADPKFSEHKYLVSKFYDIPYNEVQKSHDKDSPYDICKHIVHGSDRMMGAKRIAEQFDIDFDIAKKIQAAWKAEINDTVRWQTRVAKESERVGWTTNAFGRKLWRWESGSGTKFVSFHPQSDAADVIFRAMIGMMWRNINWPEDWAKKVAPVAIPLPEGATLFIQVHDELVVDCKPEVVDETKQILRKVMTQPWKELDGMWFPIGEAEGASWGECGD